MERKISAFYQECVKSGTTGKLIKLLQMASPIASSSSKLFAHHNDSGGGGEGHDDFFATPLPSSSLPPQSPAAHHALALHPMRPTHPPSVRQEAAMLSSPYKFRRALYVFGVMRLLVSSVVSLRFFHVCLCRLASAIFFFLTSLFFVKDPKPIPSS